GAVFIVPMFASSETELPSTADLITHKLLWLMVKGMTSASNAHNLVCEVVGGAKDSGELLAEGQTGGVFAVLTNVFVPQGWLLEIARRDGMFTIPKAGVKSAEPSGEAKAASVSTSSPACCTDLDGRTHECRDKKTIRSKMDRVQPLTRLFSAERMLYYVAELLFNHERFSKTCTSLKARGKSQPDEHRDAGMHRYVQLQSLSVMQTGWDEASRFQHGLNLEFSRMDHRHISICDFLGPKDASTKAFEGDRTTPVMRERLRLALDNLQVFLAAYSHKNFLKSLTFRLSLMLENFGDDIRTQKRSEMDINLNLRDGPGCAKLLTLYGAQFVKDAEGLLNGCTSNGHIDFYALDQGQYHEIAHREAAPAPTTPKRDPAAADLDPDANESVKRAKQAKLFCSLHLANNLTVKDGKGALVTCSKGAACPYNHIQQLSPMTMSTALTCTRFKSKDRLMQENFKTAVAECKSFKAAGNAFTPKKTATPAARLLRKDVGAAKVFFRTLLGDGAVSEGKSATGLPGDKLSGPRVEIVDWAFDLPAQHVTLSASCLEKSLHGFLSVNEFQPMPIKRAVQRAPGTHQHALPYRPVTRMAVLMLRTLGVDEPQFARSLDSWERPTVGTGLIAQCDGSLSGGGILFLAASADGTERPVGLAAVDLRALGFGDDSGFQNTAEYISMTAASRGAVQLRR
ncbi:hypothetical protein B484DRAFT_464363, partial [Ochromonadaceae sp. CCMP2298]